MEDTKWLIPWKSVIHTYVNWNVISTVIKQVWEDFVIIGHWRIDQKLMLAHELDKFFKTSGEALDYMRNKLPEDIEALKEKIKISEETIEEDKRQLAFLEEAHLLFKNK